MSWRSLEDAILYGTGVERAFLCPAHPDHDASASVNSITGLFVCYACGWRGKVNEANLQLTPEAMHRFVTTIALEMEPNRRYSESWLNAFDATGPGPYWLGRFHPATCQNFRLGYAEGVATYPMRDNSGQVMGVVSRDLTGSREQKYLYPAGVRNSQYLIDYHRVSSPTVILVEGMTDVCAAFETGLVCALGCYRAWLSEAQAMLLRKYDPERIVVAFDQDPAGEKGYHQVRKLLAGEFTVDRLWWDDYKDLAQIPLAERTEMLTASV